MPPFPPLDFPPAPLKVKRMEGKLLTLDVIRRKWVALTPEEWVRQHLIHYLVQQRGCPASLLAVETPVRYARLNKRSDLVVCDNEGHALLLAECKAPDVPLSEKVFEQIAVYHQTLRASCLLVTNGRQHYCMTAATALAPAALLNEIPDYAALKEKWNDFCGNPIQNS